MDANTSELTAFSEAGILLRGTRAYENLCFSLAVHRQGAVQNRGNAFDYCYFGRVKEEKNRQIWAIRKFNV